jgi:hypothetical protein
MILRNIENIIYFYISDLDAKTSKYFDEKMSVKILTPHFKKHKYS